MPFGHLPGPVAGPGFPVRRSFSEGGSPGSRGEAATRSNEEAISLRYSVAVTSRWADWFGQAEADVAHARHALKGDHHEWACFAAQQAAEKAVKAVHAARGQDAWGHSVTELLDALRESGGKIDEAMLDRSRALDKLYVATRDPHWLPSGAPADYYTRAEGERALADAESLIEWCRRELPR